MILLNGKETSKKIREELAKEVKQLKLEGKKTPHLAAILVGADGASRTYVDGKVKASEEVGFTSTLIELPSTVSEEELLQRVELLNQNGEIDGFIVQLPLPKHINEKNVIQAISPKKDVDGFHPENVGKMTLNLDTFLPATPNGIIELLKRYEIDTEGKYCVVVGRSNIVGSPMSILLAKNSYPGNCTVTLAHSKTKDLKEFTKKADILVVALGKPEFIEEDMVKEGAVIIDVGITRVSDTTKKKGYRIAGDVNFSSVSSKCSYITPVPGGVGPMTIASLMQNTLKASKTQRV